MTTLFTGTQPTFAAGFLNTNLVLFTQNEANVGQQVQVDFGGGSIVPAAETISLGEPGGLAIMSLGLMGLAGLRRRRTAR